MAAEDDVAPFSAAPRVRVSFALMRDALQRCINRRHRHDARPAKASAYRSMLMMKFNAAHRHLATVILMVLPRRALYTDLTPISQIRFIDSTDTMEKRTFFTSSLKYFAFAYRHYRPGARHRVEITLITLLA